MIRLENLTYFYRGNALASISGANAEIAPGINLLLGENGAGKTTLLHLMAGLLTPAEGFIDFNGENPSERRPLTMEKIFLVADEVLLPTNTIREFAEVHSAFYPTFDVSVFEECLRRFSLTGHEKFNSLSLGNRKKAYIGYALALKVGLLLLDEPANGLDITSKQTLQQLLAELIDETQTVVISTHTPSEFAYLYDGLVVLNHSKLIVSMPTWQVAERIAFGSAMLPPDSPLYMEQRMGLFRYIVPAGENESTDVDFLLLYNALLSPVAPAIVKLLNTPDNEQ